MNSEDAINDSDFESDEEHVFGATDDNKSDR